MYKIKQNKPFIGWTVATVAGGAASSVSDDESDPPTVAKTSHKSLNYVHI